MPILIGDSDFNEFLAALNFVNPGLAAQLVSRASVEALRTLPNFSFEGYVSQYNLLVEQNLKPSEFEQKFMALYRFSILDLRFWIAKPFICQASSEFICSAT